MHGSPYRAIFDAPTGTYRLPELDEDLFELSERPGFWLPHYAPVAIRSLLSLHNDSAVLRALLAQLRWLRSLDQDVRPHLRAAMPADYGRTQMIAWYDVSLERFWQAGQGFPGPIDPEAIDPVCL